MPGLSALHIHISTSSKIRQVTRCSPDKTSRICCASNTSTCTTSGSDNTCRGCVCWSSCKSAKYTPSCAPNATLLPALNGTAQCTLLPVSGIKKWSLSTVVSNTILLARSVSCCFAMFSTHFLRATNVLAYRRIVYPLRPRCENEIGKPFVLLSAAGLALAAGPRGSSGHETTRSSSGIGRRMTLSTSSLVFCLTMMSAWSKRKICRSPDSAAAPPRFFIAPL